ncbi:FAD binding domain-containing protein [Thelephora terrestris]|uniref:Fumarate reductase n=1 Tax=Thelephora terrestris TaxID=56493 RepID=A0A9P6H352_9AGAM|nr:FAD binding domain-containing protein [Thelephora terrestris]
MARVIVVGGGLAGLSAAHTLLERGANVILLDKQPFMGGNSTKATSGINGAGTQSQQDLGIQDSSRIFFEDTKKSARDLARDDLITVLTGRSGDAVNWLQDKFQLDLSKVARLGGHSQPRTHRGDAQFPGMVITYAQMERLEDLAISNPERVIIKKKARVTKLVKDGSAVIGVEYTIGGKTETAYGPVILATGGYAADFTESSLLKKYRPEFWELPTTNGDHCTGDGHKIAISIGASSIDMEKVQVHPTGLVDPNEPGAKVKFLAAEALRGVGGLLLNSEGKRFVDELQHRDFVTGKIWEQKGKHPIRLVLNGEASKQIEWHCKHYVGRGLMKRYENGAALAKDMGISPAQLEQSFKDYNNVVRTKKCPFGKKFFQPGEWKMDDIFNVALMTPVLHYTMGGLEIDPESRVLGTGGKPIPGLFAAGEVAGGVHGANRLGGSSLLGCVVFGRVSGDSAAAYLLQQTSALADKATGRLGAVAGHLEAAKPQEQLKPETKTEPSKAGAKAFTLDEVAKHTKKDDIWVVVNGQVLDVTSFLPDHPGGEKAIMLYAGRDATEEFNMLHDPKVIPRYAPDSVIGTLKK